ncbi:putative NAD(+)--arginine ADP-ribosyltransferase Mav [Canis lupus familiaris]|uniref:putative NAD(+)--arginine ADP-ribosyltransferase Mav n=1 Tax=Canis lupus familiaris TaxID=9615 RepID=UPI0015F19A84|nr:putative NAD(+)--arginine ADP-ribosyltransferase Mav [Canis lupus familiaris]
MISGPTVPQNREARAPGVRHQAGFHPLPSKSCRWQLDTRLRTNRGEQSALGRSPTTIQGTPLQGRGGERRAAEPLPPLTWRIPRASSARSWHRDRCPLGAPSGWAAGPWLRLPCPFWGPFLGRGAVRSGTGLGRCPLVSLSAGLGLPLLPWAPPGGNVRDLVSRAHMHLDHPLDMGLPGTGVPQCTGRWAPGGRRGPSPTESGSQRPGPGGQPGAAAPRPHLYRQQPPPRALPVPASPHLPKAACGGRRRAEGTREECPSAKALVPSPGTDGPKSRSPSLGHLFPDSAKSPRRPPGASVIKRQRRGHRPRGHLADIAPPASPG